MLGSPSAELEGHSQGGGEDGYPERKRSSLSSKGRRRPSNLYARGVGGTESLRKTMGTAKPECVGYEPLLKARLLL